MKKKIKRTYDYVNALDFVCASDFIYGGGRGLISMWIMQKKCSTIYKYNLISGKISPSFQNPHSQNICQKNWNGVTW